VTSYNSETFWYTLLVFSLAPDYFVLLQYTGGGGGGQAVAQLVEALRYKPEGRGFIGIFQ